MNYNYKVNGHEGCISIDDKLVTSEWQQEYIVMLCAADYETTYKSNWPVLFELEFGSYSVDKKYDPAFNTISHPYSVTKIK